MRMVIRYSCPLLLLLCAFSASAQEAWKSAKMVTSEGDTLKGEVAFGDWDKSPRSVRVKDAQGNTSVRSAGDIRRFSIEDPVKIFESKKLTVAYYKKTVVREGASPILKIDSATYFLEVLLRSELITLYEYFDDDREPRFFLERDGKLHELRNPVYHVARGETSHVIRSEIYKAQLKELLPECPTLNTQNVRYVDKDLVRLLTEYHDFCKTDFKTAFKQEKLGERIAFGAMWRYVPLIAKPNSYLGLNLMLFSEKRFNSAFVSIDFGFRIGEEPNDPDEVPAYRTCFGLHAGKYFGTGDWHPMIFTGISSTNGALDTGVGIMHKRFFAVSTSFGLIPLNSGDPFWSIQMRITPIANKN